MLAADAVFDLLGQDSPAAEATAYPAKLRQSWLHDELFTVRNISGCRSTGGLFPAIAYSAIDTYLSAAGRRGRCITSSRTT